MARPIRDRDPDIYRLISIRTTGAQLWITPSGKVRKLIGGIIARYQELLQIELYAYFVLGNHIHLIVKAPRSNVDEFQENVNREIARRLNWKHGREGKFWGRRYDDLKILSENDLLEAFLYVSTNATKHGLVRDSSTWTGLNSFEHSLDETDRIFIFQHHSQKDLKKRVSRHRLKLSILPQFRNMSAPHRRRIVEKLLRKRMESLAKEREARGEGFLGQRAISEQTPGKTPVCVARGRRPACYTKNPILRRQYRAKRRELMRSYREASTELRLGNKFVVFPIHTFSPPTHRAPRIAPFVPLTVDSSKICLN